MNPPESPSQGPQPIIFKEPSLGSSPAGPGTGRPSVTSLAHLVNLANDLREAFGGPPLTDLPRSKPGNAQQCLIARAFNFGCEIHPSGLPLADDCEYGYAQFEAPEHAARFAELVHGRAGSVIRVVPAIGGHYRYRVPLSTELNQIAIAFDNGRLPEYTT